VGCYCSSTGESVKKSLRHLARQEGGLGVSLKVMLLLLQVVVPVMTLRLHSLRLEVTGVQQQFHLLCGFTLTGKFVLRQLLNRDRMNKLFQLSVSVSFTLRVICLDLFSYMLPNISIQSIEHESHILRLP
jgi:uncharacterized membrane protein